MIDRERLTQDALHVIDAFEDRSPAAARVARVVLAALEDPTLLLPEGWFAGRRPELFDKGIPQR